MIKKEQSEILDSDSAVGKKHGFLSKPQNLFLLSGILILIIPLFFWGQSVVIHIDKPRIFISGEFFIYIVSVMLIVGWIIYNLTDSTLAMQYLSWIHVGITLAALLFFLLTSSWYFKLNESSKIQAYFLKSLMVSKQYNVQATGILGIIFIIGQLAYLINLTLGLIGIRYKNGA